ncbi:MAG: TetR/AcrR family transcriptional regulator [Actinomycetaceae bacterium]|nr:TetR/AcrR family transcriptional regulator [Actinomycetaceae bacterium]MDU0970423.1 TetR/AcrR family transcriptional regulator [Actinomycetaceae bacterium]
MTPPQRPKDLRVEKTIAAIHATFKAMLLAQPFATITVTALCERARINKKTFYRYYPTIDYLLRELQEEYTSSYLQRIAGLRFPEDAEVITREFLTYCVEQDELYEKITCAGPHDAIREEMIRTVNAGSAETLAAPSRIPEDQWNLYLAFAGNVALSLYQQWVRDGKQTPADVLIDTGCAIVAAGTRAFLEEAGESLN